MAEMKNPPAFRPTGELWTVRAQFPTVHFDRNLIWGKTQEGAGCYAIPQ
jgi:hypothetical protein